MSNARTNILSRLRAAPVTVPQQRPHWQASSYGAARLEKFRSMLEAVHGEVIECSNQNWMEALLDVLQQRRIALAMASPSLSETLTAHWPQGPRVMAYDHPVEEVKDQLVHTIQAGITHARAAIAETGSLVLWPNREDPRLLSLLPPLHIVLLRGSALADSLADLMHQQGWVGQMPTNALLISGPSKTADIEQTLAYGVHGPRELVVLVLTDE